MACKQTVYLEFIGGLATPVYSGTVVTYTLNTTYSELLTTRPDLRWVIGINIPDVCQTKARAIVRNFLRQYNLYDLVCSFVFLPVCSYIIGSQSKDISIEDELLEFYGFYGDGPSSSSGSTT